MTKESIGGLKITFNSSSSIYEFLLEKGTEHIIIRHALAVLNFVSKCWVCEAGSRGEGVTDYGGRGRAYDSEGQSW
jgi:hypothetical protein